MIYFISAFLFVSLCMAILLLFSFIKKINDTSTIIKDIINGNSNRRVHLGAISKSLKGLCIDLNKLLDKFEENNIKVRDMEISQKRVISNISHDMRTPLTSLLGYLEMLQKDESLSEEEKASYLEIALLKGKSLYALVQDFFEMAKLDSDDTQIEFKKVDILNAVQEIVLSFYTDFQKNNIQPKLELPEGMLYIWADVAYLERIMQNLISNSLCYGKDGGVIGITLREERDIVWVDIWDRGKGIPEKDIKKVFERLYMSDQSRNSNHRGNGLGLSIARQLVEKMKGEIFVSSIQNVKTTFSFYLPRCE